MFSKSERSQQSAQFKRNEDQASEGKSMSPPAFQLKAGESSGGGSASGSNSKLDPAVQAKMEGSLGADFSGVNIVENSSKAKDANALAFTQGENVHFAPGQLKQDTQAGQELIGHELTHVVQQRKGSVAATTSVNGMAVNNDKGLESEADAMGAKAARGEVAMSGKTSGTAGGDQPMQGYFVQNPEAETPTLVSEDLSVAVVDDARKHTLFAEKGKAKESNAKLKGAKANLSMFETDVTSTFEKDGKSKELVQIMPRNNANGTEGDNMELYADCGRSTAQITGSTDREAVHNDMQGNAKTTHGKGDPYYMKAAIFSEVFKSLANDEEFKGNRALESKVKRVDRYKEQLDEYRDQYHAETDTKKKERIGKKYSRTSQKIVDAYYSLSERYRNDFDRRLGINDYADPEVGQGFTMSTGGRTIRKDDTWNFHWAGVVMKSSDGKDSVSLENFAVGDWDAQNDDWEFNLYGPAEKDGQTFHDKHKATAQHGSSPTTMAVQSR